MSEMIKRVAKAIRDTNENTVGLTFRELSFAMACAAIEAMREPTDAMVEAAFTALVPAGDAYPCWRAMIDAALQPATDTSEAK